MKHVVTAAPLRQCIVVTGYGAFPGARKNPTEAILGKLERQRERLARLGIVLRCVRLPVIYGEIDTTLREAVALYRPDAILHLGLAGRRRYLSVETRAINRAGPLHLDASGRSPGGQSLDPRGPASVAATYRAAPILAALRRSGLPARRSIDAGDYVCNATLYRSLREQMAPQVGFLHVPRVRRANQPSRRAKLHPPTVDTLTAAVVATMLVMATPRRHSRPSDPA